MKDRVVEFGNRGLWQNEIECQGKYSLIIHHLKEIGLFSTNREAYIVAAILGLVNGRKVTYDVNEVMGEKRKKTDQNDEVSEISIQPGDLVARKQDLRLIYRVAMLVEDNPSFTIEDYMNRAFRDDSDTENPENLKRNMAIVNSYVGGGLEYLDEKFGSLHDIEEVVDALYELVHGFAVEVELLEDDELLDWDPEY